jgi:prolyl oligopeptidase
VNIPPARRDETQDNYHGTIVVDPYRWLEDAASAETQSWSEAQNTLARAYLNALPARERIQARYTELMNYPKYGVPRKKGDRYYFSQNSGLQNQAVLYMQQPLGAESKLVLDPNTLSSDGTVALTNQAFSQDGRLLAYGTSSSGSDWQELRIRDVDSGSDYDDMIRWCKFTGVAWRHDDTGYSFYYSRFPQPETVPQEDQTNFNKVYWHKVGTTQEEDVLVYERPDQKELAFDPFITDDEQYLLLHVWHGTDPKNRVYYREVASDASFVRLLDEADASYNFIGNDGPLFYFQTDLDASRGRIVAIDIRQPERENWRELVPEQEDVIAFSLMVNSQLVIAFMHHAHHVLHIYRTDGSFVRNIALPTLGSIAGISGKQTDTELFFSFTSFLYPPSVYRYDFTDQTTSLLYGTEVKFDPSNYTTQQVFYTSKDGTRVPMFLIHKKDLMLDGNNPVLLYGYGGFNVSLTPAYSTNINLWVEHGGVYAVANLRGGNEYGEEWHQAGMLAKKQNVFDDFIAAAEWLISNKYTSSSRLAITGGSNGGLLVAACMLQRPELYGAVVCRVPVIDMLRYHRFTVGRYWIPEYGNAEQSEEHFRFLYAYSPLHNIKPGTVYPPTLIMTADTDDRVVPAHAKKFTATLQPANGGSNPILLRLEMKAGHGLGKPITKIIEEESDMLAFLFDQFSMQV